MRLGVLPGGRGRVVAALLFAAVLLPLVSTRSDAVQVCNNNPITFTPPASPTAAVLPFDPYPSVINVSGFTGTVTDVNVLLNGFTYPFPEDVDVLLVAPNGTSVLVMSDIGGNNDGVGDPVSNINLVFDDQAANFAPMDTLLLPGTYRPTDDDDDPGEFVPGHADTFLPPAPMTPGGSSLAAFNGINPNGTWSLFVVDDDPGPPQPGSFSGWCLDITTTGTGPTTTGPTTTGPTTTSTSTTVPAPTTTTTRPPTTTTAPTTTTSTTTTVPAPTTTTSTTTTVPAPTTTTTRPTTTTTAPTTTTTVPPAPQCSPPTGRISGLLYNVIAPRMPAFARPLIESIAIRYCLLGF